MAPLDQQRGGNPALARARAPDARRWLTAPNLLSLARLPLGALFWLVIDDDPADFVGPFAVLAAAAATDVLDGHLARRSGVTSGIGSWLDPICDKLFVAAVLGAIALHRRPPLELLALIIGRELCQLPLTLTYRLVPRLHHWLHYDFSASPLGKAATVMQFVAVAALLIDHPLRWEAAWLAFGVGMAALADYLRRAIGSPRG
ncbi:MAG TPA: CDP-alcohol phosphatidyltransferase family protein [Polyangia bacterium]|nr:CDP-alcohol phosphatidyltransferase family protein [Polyangia bacterium]